MQGLPKTFNYTLASVLFGQELTNGSLIVQATLPTSDSLSNAQADIADYVFSRGKGEASASVEGGTDSNGNSHVSGDVGVSKEFDNGVKVDASAGVSASRDRDGNVQGETHAKASISIGF